jgi:hypothetical protein
MHSLEIFQQFFISLAFRFEFEAMDDLQRQKICPAEVEIG